MERSQLEARKIALIAVAATALIVIAGIGVTNWFNGAFGTSASIRRPADANFLTSDLSFSARVKQQPLELDPFEVLAHAKSPDPSLQGWLENWQAQHAKGQAIDAGQIAQLNVALEHSPLGAEDLLALAHAFHHLSDDMETTARFYDAASLRVASELGASGAAVDKCMPLLVSIRQHMDDYKHVLWPLIDERHEMEYTNTILRFYSNFTRIAQESSDITLVNSATHPRIGAAECLFLQGRSNEAISKLQEMNPESMTQGEKCAWSWAMGLALSDNRKYREAVPFIKFAMETPQFRYRDDAELLLIKTTGRAGMSNEAESLREDYIARVHPNVQLALELETEVEVGKAVPH